MKKVAILTQPLHTNYGGTLQAYALQKIIKDMGAEATTLNYQWKQKTGLRFLLSILKSFLLNRKEKFPFLPKEQLLREKNHKLFIEKYINRSNVIFNESELIKHFEKVDYVAAVVGSDQVWRLEYSSNIDHFFLSFIDKPIKKIAYAASFGLDSWQFSPEKTHQIKKWLSAFDAISVREDSAARLCHDNLNISVEHVLDPTLLLTKNDYCKLINDLPEINRGVFSYFLDRSSDKEFILNTVTEKLGLSSFTKQPEKLYKSELFIKDESQYLYPHIEEWISAFRDSSFIVTDSFHGAVFSIIFNKPFLVIMNNSRGAARFKSLLTKFSLEHRLLRNVEDLSDKLIFEKMNYEEINNNLVSLRCFSLNFLKKSLFSDDKRF